MSDKVSYFQGEGLEKLEREEQSKRSALSRRQLFKKGGIVAGLVSALSLTPFSQTEAAAQTVAESVQIIDLTGTHAEKYIQATLASADYQQFKGQLASQYPDIFNVQETAAVVVFAQTSLDRVVSVHIPVQGGAGHSFYAAILQPSSAALLTTRSGIFLPASDGNIAVVMHQNGTAVLDAVMTPKGTFVQGILTTGSGKQFTLSGLSAQEAAAHVLPEAPAGANPNICCIADGLVELGFIGIVIGLLVVPLCGVACAATLGAGCVACIAGATGLAGFLIGAIIDNCNNNRNFYLPVVC